MGPAKPQTRFFIQLKNSSTKHRFEIRSSSTLEIPAHSHSTLSSIEKERKKERKGNVIEAEYINTLLFFFFLSLSTSNARLLSLLRYQWLGQLSNTASATSLFCFVFCFFIRMDIKRLLVFSGFWGWRWSRMAMEDLFCRFFSLCGIIVFG